MEPKIKTAALTAILESESLSSEEKITAILSTGWLEKYEVTRMAAVLVRELLRLAYTADVQALAEAVLAATDANAGSVEMSGDQLIALGNAKKAIPERLYALLKITAAPIKGGNHFWQSPTWSALLALQHDTPRAARGDIRWHALLEFLGVLTRVWPAPWRGILYTDKPARTVLAQYNAASEATGISLVEWLMQQDGAAGCVGPVDWQACAASLRAEADAA